MVTGRTVLRDLKEQHQPAPLVEPRPAPTLGGLNGTDADWWVINDFTGWSINTSGSGATGRYLRAAWADGFSGVAEIFQFIRRKWGDQLDFAQANYGKNYCIEFLGTVNLFGNSNSASSWGLKAATGTGYSNKGFDFYVTHTKALQGRVHNGTSLTTVNLGLAMVANTIYRLRIVFTAGVDIVWYVGIMGETIRPLGQSANIPSGTLNDADQLTISALGNSDRQITTCHRISYARDW